MNDLEVGVIVFCAMVFAVLVYIYVKDWIKHSKRND